MTNFMRVRVRGRVTVLLMSLRMIWVSLLRGEVDIMLDIDRVLEAVWDADRGKE